MCASLPDLSVVVVNWNNVDELMPCLRSLDEEDAAQIVLVDNGSEDDSVARVRRELPRIEIVETRANLGFAEGVNRGLALARGDWVFTLNNDAVIERDGLRRLRALAGSSAPDVGMLQPLIVFKDRPHHVNSTGVTMSGDAFAYDRYFMKLTGGAEREPREVFCCTAGAALYRRRMLDALRLSSGVFDRGYFMYFEDVDLGWRARLAGWRAFYEPSVRVAHRYQASSRRHGRGWVWRMCRDNRVRTLLKNASLGLIRRALPSIARGAGYDLARFGRAPIALARATREAWPQRAEVEGIRQVTREEVEARWIA